MNELRAAALAYAQAGVYVFPCGRDKRPLTPEGFKNATVARDNVNAFWTRHPQSNIGIDVGRSGLAIIDIDGPEGIKPFKALELPRTRTVTTGREEGGSHHWFRPAGGVTVPTRKLGPSLETRGNGSYVIAPPSIHATGKRYQSDGAPIATLTEVNAMRILAAAAAHAEAIGQPIKSKADHTRTFATSDPHHEALKAIPTEAYFWLLTGQQLNHKGFAPCPLPWHDDWPGDGGSFHAAHGTGWVCFGCQARGDVFTLARALWGDPPFPEVRRRLVEAVLRGGEGG